eukprot:TRINITY_DN3790_c0_g1_i2.p1 TRINITY_DN3790_c0_g1~~TRINITY_DN3790_c0_g1_i2.p1  ORF type:complete len:630 (-),score=179.93 TRINITY_DN3790_c0_g1_i2:74-1963(-)
MRARPQEQAKSYKDREFRVWMPQGLKQVFIYDGDKLLSEILEETKKANNIDEAAVYKTYHHGTGEEIENVQVPLSSLSVLEIYFYPAGRSPPTRTGGEAPQRRSLMATKAGRPGPGGDKRPGSSSSVKTSSSSSKKKEEFEERNGAFTLTIDAMQDLANNNPNLEYLYFILTNGISEKQYRSEKVAAANDMPEWQQVFKFPVNCDVIDFQLVLWGVNKDQTADLMLGEVSNTISKFSDGDQRFAIWKLKKEPKKYKKDKERSGEIMINWKYQDKKRKALQEGETHGTVHRGRTQVLLLPSAITPSPSSDLLKSPKADSVSEDASTDAKTPKADKQDKKHRSSKKDASKKRESQPVIEEEPGALEDVYDLGEELGSGAFSIVKAGVHKKNGTLVAVKVLDNYGNLEGAEEEMESFQRETSIMQAIRHTNIVQLMDVFEDEEHYYVVMERVGGGELFDQIIDKGNYEEDEAAVLVHQVFSALAYLHSKGFAHRDIKPENLLFSDNNYDTLKIVDFGEAKFVGEGLTEYVGTPDYMAPEILKGQKYTQLVDTWAMGVVLYIMLCGFPPFDGENDTDVLCNIMNIAYEFPSPEWDEVSEEAKDFIRRLMTDANTRMSSKEALKHPWLTERIKK